MFNLLGNLCLAPSRDSISAPEYELRENLAGGVSGLTSCNRSDHRVRWWLPVTMKVERHEAQVPIAFLEKRYSRWHSPRFGYARFAKACAVA